MRPALPARFRFGRRVTFALLATSIATVALTACAQDAPPEEPPAAESVEPPADSAPVPAAFVTGTVPFSEGTFPHRAHASVACARCHTDLRGHATHAGTACNECHTPPVAATTAPSSECNACHHAADRDLACTHCHTSSAPPRSVATPLVIASQVPVSRVLSFDHERHAQVACRTCHTAGAALAVERTCAGCHTDHHRAAADCASCHPPFPLATHDASAHRGCTGQGCHAESTAWAAPLQRSPCLVCHRAQTDHEPGGECGACHVLSGGGP